MNAQSGIYPAFPPGLWRRIVLQPGDGDATEAGPHGLVLLHRDGVDAGDQGLPTSEDLGLLAVDLGLALATLFIFFAFTMRGIEPPSWWGNDVVGSTMDMQGTAVEMRVLGTDKFGPKSW